MKTIEEKAFAFAGKAMIECKQPDGPFDLTQSAVLGMYVRDAYLAGAAEALAGQWSKQDDTEGLQDGERVIKAVQRIDDNSIRYCFSAYLRKGCFWYEYDDAIIHSFNLWMRLPELPKDEIE